MSNVLSVTHEGWLVESNLTQAELTAVFQDSAMWPKLKGLDRYHYVMFPNQILGGKLGNDKIVVGRGATENIPVGEHWTRSESEINSLMISIWGQNVIQDVVTPSTYTNIIDDVLSYTNKLAKSAGSIVNSLVPKDIFILACVGVGVYLFLYSKKVS